MSRVFSTQRAGLVATLLASIILCAACSDTGATSPPTAENLDVTQRTGTDIAAEAESATEEPDIIVTVLGSGTPAPSTTQNGPAILVQAAGQNLMFDCGRGCTTRLAELDPNLIREVDRLFVTHLHSDHIVGVDDLWLNGWTQGRLQPLKIVGPVGTQSFMQHLRSAFGFDIDTRFTDGVPGTLNGLADDITEVTEDGVVYQQDGVQVTVFEVEHSTVKPAWGYRIDYAGRSVLISGDTGPAQSLYDYGEGVDVFLLEVMSPALIAYLGTIFEPPQVAKVVAYHTTAEQAAEIFEATAPRLGVYYHTRNEPRFADSLLEVTRAGYEGPLVVSHDLLQIRIDDEIDLVDRRR